MRSEILMVTEKDVSQDSLAPADLALRLQRQLDAAQQVTHIGSWDWDLATGHVTWSDELYRIYGLEPRKVEISLEGFLARVHPDDRERVQREVSAAVQRGGRFAHRERIVRPDGSVRELDTVGDVLVDTQGRPVTVIGTCHDITDDPRERAQRLQAGERRALEMLAAGAPLPEILAELARLIEEMLPGTVTSILLMDSGTRVKNDNAPSLPDTSKLAVHGIFLGSPASSSDTRSSDASRCSSLISRPTHDGSRIATWPAPMGCAPAGRIPSWPPMAILWGPSRSTICSRGPQTRRRQNWWRASHT